MPPGNEQADEQSFGQLSRNFRWAHSMADQNKEDRHLDGFPEEQAEDHVSSNLFMSL